MIDAPTGQGGRQTRRGEESRLGDRRRDWRGFPERGESPFSTATTESVTLDRSPSGFRLPALLTRASECTLPEDPDRRSFLGTEIVVCVADPSVVASSPASCPYSKPTAGQTGRFLSEIRSLDVGLAWRRLERHCQRCRTKDEGRKCDRYLTRVPVSDRGLVGSSAEEPDPIFLCETRQIEGAAVKGTPSRR